MFTTFSEFSERFNDFLYRQSIRRLSDAEITLARDWSLEFIRREHPHLDEEQIERFYEKLVQVEYVAVDEWSRRMS